MMRQAVLNVGTRLLCALWLGLATPGSAWADEPATTFDAFQNLEEAFKLHQAGTDLYQRGQYREAELQWGRALTIFMAIGPDHPATALSLNSLALALKAQGRYSAAKPLLERALAIFERASGPDHPQTAAGLDNLAGVSSAQGRYGEAEALNRRALAIWEKVSGPDHPNTAISLNNLAGTLRDQGRYGEAEPLLRRALAIFEKILPPDPPTIALSLNNLAMALYVQGRYSEAEPLLRRALAIAEKVRGPGHPDTALNLNNLAETLRAQGHADAAEPLLRRASEIYEQALGSDHPDTATSLNNLAETLHDQGRYPDAETLYRRTLAIYEKALGPGHPDTARAMNNLAQVLRSQGRLAEAEPLFHRSLTIIQSADNPALLLRANRNLGFFLVQRGQLLEALPHYRAAADALDRLFGQTRGLSEEARLTFLGQYAYVYREFLDLLLKLHEQDAKAGHDRAFLAVASRNQSRIFSELLRQGDVNRLAGEPAFVALKEQRQSLLAQLGNLREKSATLPITAPNYDGQKTDLQTGIDALAADLAAVEDRLWRDYPRYMELLTLPRPVTVEQLQQELLKPGEALLSFALLPEQAVVMAVTRDRFTFHILPLTREAVAARVRAIRATLQGDLGQLETLQPADLHALYRDLIEPIEPVLKDARRRLVVADGPLHGLPLELLISSHDDAQKAAFSEARKAATGQPGRPPRLGEYAGLPYLADRYPFRYLPSLAALAAQRRYPKPARPVTRPLVAFADPVFDPQEDAAAPAATRGYSPATQQALTLLARSGTLGTFAAPLPRLPESAEEAQALAAAVPGQSRLYLRQDAQERAVKDLSRAGDLKGLRYLLFATHGLLGGEFLPPVPPPDPKASLAPDQLPRAAPRETLGQPALALTLVEPAQNEDGLLTLKEVIEDLDLTAELAILSACNTAGDGAKTDTGEGFAGLARAFLFAGARHLWVSHWPVESAAARDLTVAAVRAIEAGEPDPAAALAIARRTVRQSVVPLTVRARPGQLARAHPYFWAPFVTVGD